MVVSLWRSRPAGAKTGRSINISEFKVGDHIQIAGMAVTGRNAGVNAGNKKIIVDGTYELTSVGLKSNTDGSVSETGITVKVRKVA